MPSGVKDIQLLELKDTISQLNKTISTQNELMNNLVLIAPPVRCKVSHFIYNCFCYG